MDDNKKLEMVSKLDKSKKNKIDWKKLREVKIKADKLSAPTFKKKDEY